MYLLDADYYPHLLGYRRVMLCICILLLLDVPNHSKIFRGHVLGVILGVHRSFVMAGCEVIWVGVGPCRVQLDLQELRRVWGHQSPLCVAINRAYLANPLAIPFPSPSFPFRSFPSYSLFQHIFPYTMQHPLVCGICCLGGGMGRGVWMCLPLLQSPDGCHSGTFPLSFAFPFSHINKELKIHLRTAEL